MTYTMIVYENTTVNADKISVLFLHFNVEDATFLRQIFTIGENNSFPI